jgi:hypothetical protein
LAQKTADSLQFKDGQAALAACLPGDMLTCQGPGYALNSTPGRVPLKLRM